MSPLRGRYCTMNAAPTTMATEGKNYKINCLIEGKGDTLTFLIPCDADVMALKQLIYDGGRLEALQYGLLDVALWKVCKDFEPFEGRVSEFKFEDHPLAGVRLDFSGKPLSDLWEEQPSSRHLHIFARIRDRGVDSSTLPPSQEFLDVIGQPPPKRRRRLDEWRRGWRQLDDDDVWKQFGDYWRKQSVEATRDGPSITFAYDGRGEENPEYRLPLVPLTENKIIVRECYKSFYDRVLELRDGDDGGLVLTGQPGTGKSMWLSYALVRLLTENKTVAYHAHAGTFLFFEESTYSRISGVKTCFPPAKLPTFCLIDSDGEKASPDIGFMTNKTVIRKTFPVMASSPQPSHYSIWRKQRYSVPIESMPLWTRDELKKGLEIHPFYADLRQDVKTELCYASVDDSSTILVSPKKLIREVWDNLILSALEMIRHGGDAMDDATRESATDNTTIEVDEVLDKMLDNTIETYGSSARDVYEAIFSPVVAKEGLIKAVSAQSSGGTGPASESK